MPFSSIQYLHFHRGADDDRFHRIGHADLLRELIHRSQLSPDGATRIFPDFTELLPQFRGPGIPAIRRVAQHDLWIRPLRSTADPNATLELNLELIDLKLSILTLQHRGDPLAQNGIAIVGVGLRVEVVRVAVREIPD